MLSISRIEKSFFHSIRSPASPLAFAAFRVDDYYQGLAPTLNLSDLPARGRFAVRYARISTCRAQAS